MKVLIAGGTGFIGSHITNYFKQMGIESITLARTGQIKADVTKPESLSHVPWNDFDVLIICIQFPNHPVENYKKGFTYEKFDAQGTENICNQIKNTKIKKIIYISGAGTDEGKNQPWFKAKVRAEKAVKDTQREYVILRPSWIYGPGDHSMSRFLSFADLLPVMPIIGDGNYKCAPLYVNDLVKAVFMCATNDSIKNITAEIGGPENLSMNQIQKTVLVYKNKRKLLLPHPIWLMKLIGFVLNLVLTKPPFSHAAIDFITMDQPVDVNNFEKIFKFSPIPLIEGLKFYK